MRCSILPHFNDQPAALPLVCHYFMSTLSNRVNGRLINEVISVYIMTFIFRLSCYLKDDHGQRHNRVFTAIADTVSKSRYCQIPSMCVSVYSSVCVYLSRNEPDYLESCFLVGWYPLTREGKKIWNDPVSPHFGELSYPN